MKRKEHSLFRRYFVALMAPAVIAGVMQVTWPLFKGSPIALFMLAIIFSAWYGGFRPGLLSTIISLLLADYLFLEPYFVLGPANLADFIRIVVMTTVGICCSALSGLTHKTTHHIESILAGVADVHIIFDRKWRYVYVNDAAVRAMGRPREKILGRTLWDLFPDIIGTELERQFRRAMDERAPTFCDFYYPINDNWWANRFYPAPEGLVLFANDITERKQTEERLSEYEKVVEGLAEMIAVVDREYRYLLANRTFLKYRRLKKEQVVGHLISEVLGTEFFEEVVKENLERCFGGETVRYETTFNYPGLGERDLLISYLPIAGPHGVDRAAVILRDTTEARRTEERLRDKDRFINQIAELTPVVLGVFDFKLKRHVYFSSHVFNVYGYRASEILERKELVANVVHPDDLPRLKANMGRLASLADGEIDEFECRVLRRDGEWRWVMSRSMPFMRDSKGELEQIVFATIDITERKRAEKALAEAERQYRDIFENAGEGIFQTTPEGQYIAANPALARMHGFETSEEFINQRQDISRDVYVDPARREEFKRLVETHDVVRGFEHQIYRRDRSTIWVSINARAVRDEQGNISYYEGTTQDITERKRAEKAQRDSEHRYRNIFDFAPLGIYQARRDGTLVRANKALAKLLGYESASEFLQVNLDRDVYWDADERQRLIATYGHARSPGDFEVKWKKKDGSLVWVQLIAHTVTGPDSDEDCFEGFVRDISDRKYAAEELRRSEERYRELFENSKDALYVHDLSGRYTSFNRAAEQLSGFSRDEILGKHFSNFVSPLHLRQTRENLCKKLDYEGETTYEVDLVTKDRRRVPIEISSRLIYEEGLPVGVQGVARDITDRKRAEEAHARFALIVESSDDAIIGKNLDGTILSWNRGAEKIYGYSAREAIGSHISILVPSDRKEEVPRILESIRRGESINHYESLRERKDGKLIHVSLTISPIRDAQHRIVGASTIARDVTERRQAEQALQTFSRRLIEVQEAERQHIARELHDEIGQVLTAVRINLLSLRGSAPSKSALPIDDSLAIVDEALNRVRELSLNLRPPVLDNLGLSSALRWYVDRYARRSGIVADLQTDLEGRRLRVDLETACFRITQEALTNIARHAQATHVLVRLKCTNGNLDLKIIDNGVGFDVGALIKGSDSALGLRGMEERAVAARGHLKIDSAPTRGTEVRASFPLKDGD